MNKYKYSFLDEKGIYDNRFLIKKTKSLENSGLKEQIPYPSAKPMLLVDSENLNK